MNKKIKKVLVLTTTFPRWEGDTIQLFVYELSRRLRENGLEIFILAPHHWRAEKFEVMGGLKVFRFPYFYPSRYQRLAYGQGILFNIKHSFWAKIQVPLLFLSELFYAVKIVKQNKIDIVHSHWLIPSGIIGAICKKALGTPHITTLHGSDINTMGNSGILRKICSFIIRNSDRVTANSSYTKSKIISIDDGARDKVEIIPMGVDADSFKPGDITLKYSIKEEYSILTVGRLVNWKGTQYLIMAMVEVIKSFPKAKLLVIGDGPERTSLEALAIRLGLKDNVLFLGVVKNADLPRYYISADIFCLPSVELAGQTEALGVVLLEAMACGTPVIASRVGGTLDIIEDGHNGLLVPQKSPHELSSAIIAILSNPEAARKFSTNGRATIEKKFSWEYVVDRFYKIYEHL
ncbi:MAG: glycosyltransferase [Candidatus Omnitrophica bacterium]|nr:glycosyltransferase [Candidatus Omnitrophota bacterium]